MIIVRTATSTSWSRSNQTLFSLLNLIDVEHIIEDATGLQAQATVRRPFRPALRSASHDDILEVF